MEPFVLSPESAAKFFILDERDLSRAKKYNAPPSGILTNLRTEIERIAGNRDLLTDDEKARLAPIIDLSGLRLGFHKINLSYCVLNNSRCGTDLTEARFYGSSLRDADFRGAYLANVSFNNADLTGADFRRAELHNVDFSGADLTNADFTDVRDKYTSSPVSSDYFVGAKNLDKAIGLPPEVLTAARQAAFGAAGQKPAAQGASPA
jgi:uncharacterized protein YjbI with pentapeptide repeats